MKAFAGITECFTAEKINIKRQPELDLAKGLAILFMVWTHVFDELSPNSEGVPVLLVRNILGGPFAAPVFMICLGIGVSYSRKNAPKDLCKRGLGLLGIGLLLNLFRYVLPDLAKYALTGQTAYLTHTFSLFSVDILQFAGLAFLFLALVNKMNVNHSTLLILGISASLAGAALRGASTGNYAIDQFIGFLWGTDTRSYFPFLNWLIFPIFGVIFGTLLQHCKDKGKFYSRIAPYCIGVVGVYVILTIRFGLLFSSAGSYYFLGLPDAAVFIFLAVGFFGVNHALVRRLPEALIRTLTRWSKNINTIYCIH